MKMFNEFPFDFYLPEIKALHWQPTRMAHSTEIIVCIYKINDFPYTVSMRRTHDEPFDEPHIHRHH